MHLHFVCSGNAYRSRLAEAYCRRLVQSQKLTVSSSGIGATENRLLNGPICWYAMRLIKRNNLIPFMSWTGRQTTKAILKDVDYLVCMSQPQFDYCQNQLGWSNKPYEIWDIPDLPEMDGFIPSTKPGIQTEINHIKLAEQTYAMITKKVDKLISKLL